LLSSFPARADVDSGLYGPKISKEASFIRFVNLESDLISPQINNHKFPDLGVGEVSLYYEVKKTKINFSTQKKTFTENILQGQFYTLVVTDKPKLIKDNKSKDRTKAVIAFYNLSERNSLTLKVNNKINVFSDVTAMSMEARDINAAKINLNIINGTEEFATVPDVILERGHHYSIIFDGKSAQFVQARIDHQK
jgi:hypothetical protein